MKLDHDILWPRDDAHRFRIYRRLGDHLDVLAATDCPEGVGAALVQLHADCKEAGLRLADLGHVGVLDAVAGEWVLLPFSRSERPATFGPLPIPIKED